MTFMSQDFFNYPARYLESLNHHGATQLLKCMRNELPFCKGIITDLVRAQESLDRLEEKVSYIDDEEGSLLVEDFRECRAIFERVMGTNTPSSIAETSSSMSDLYSIEADTLASLSPISELQRSTPMECKEEIWRAINEGELARALFIISQGLVKLEELDLESDVEEWMRLNLTFHPHATTSIETMALSNYEGRQGLGLGYKSANLTRLQALSKEVTKRCTTCRIAVPSFHPVGDFEMQHYVMAHYPSLKEDWNQFIETFTPDEIENFTAGSLILGEEAKRILAHIRDEITRTFNENVYDTPQLREWLVKQAPGFVIVRSTGREDSDTNSNAGGNASLAFINPNPKEISLAMGEVLASYFGDKSILQRLAAGDASIFEREVFLPVLIQEMVGETVGGVGTPVEGVPRSGVMFTRSSARAQGLTELCVGLGNNEGIVSSRVATDRYFLDSCGGVCKAIEHKDTRFVALPTPEGGYTCGPIKNCEIELRESASLPDSVARDMKTLGDYFSCEVYGEIDAPKALDMEFSVIAQAGLEKPTIYLLQARPLLSVEAEHQPSYLEAQSLTALPHEKQVHGKTLLDGGAYVRSSETSTVIVCDTITQALDQYLKSPPDIKSATKTVIIRKQAPSTSHEAVTLRARGVGILVVQDEEGFRSIQSNIRSGKPILVDLQRGVVAQATLAQVPSKEGYTCYPMPLEYSMTPSRMILHLASLAKKSDPTFAASTRVELKDFGDALQRQISSLVEGRPLIEATGSATVVWQSLLEKMGSGTAEEARSAAASLLDSVQRLTRSSKLEALPMTRLELLMILQEISCIVEKQFLPSTIEPPQSLERLYPLRILEACLFQEGDVIGGFSVAGCLQAMNDQKEILALSHVSMEKVVEAEQALKNAPLVSVERLWLNPQRRELWQTLVQRLNILPVDQLDKINQQILKLNQLGVLTSWVNTQLDKILQEQHITSVDTLTDECLKNLFSQIETVVDDSFHELQEAVDALESLKTLRSQMAIWANPDHIKKQAHHLMALMNDMGFTVDPRNERSFSSRYRVATSTGRRVLLQTALDGVRTYDEIIKTLKSSTLYESSIKQATNFKRFLDQYHVMMMSVVDLARQEGFFTRAPGMQNDVEKSGMSIEEYFDRFDIGYEYTQEPRSGAERVTPGFNSLDPLACESEESARALMLPSEHFSVVSATIGGVSDYNYSAFWPTTLEDYFTLIHQNMEAGISAVCASQDIPRDLLPVPLQTYLSQLQSSIVGLSITSINIKDGLIDVAINMPLRQHAATLHVTYDVSKDVDKAVMETKISMFGQDEHSRWPLVAGAISLLGTDMSKLQVEPPEVNFGDPNGVSFALICRGVTQIDTEHIVKFLTRLNGLTMSRSPVEKYVDAVKTLRRSLLAPGDLPFTPENIMRGGFYLALQSIDDFLMMGDVVKASAVLDNLKSALYEKPALLELQSGVGFFNQDDTSSLQEALAMMDAKVEKIRAEGAVLSPWMQFLIFQRNLPKRPLHLLQSATAAQKRDRDFVLQAVRYDPENFTSASIELKDDPIIALEAIRRNPSLFHWAGPTIKADLEIQKIALTYSRTCFERASSTERDNPILAQLAIERDGMSLELLNATFRDHTDMVLRAVLQNGLALQHASKKMRANLEIVQAAISQNGLALAFVDPTLRESNEEINRLAIKNNPLAYAHASLAVRSDPIVAKMCLQHHPELIKAIPLELRNNDLFVKEVMASLPPQYAITFFKALPTRLQNNFSILEVALSRNGMIFQHISHDFIANKPLAIIAIAQNSRAIEFIDPSLLEDVDVALAAVSASGLLLSRFNESIRSNKQVVIAAVKQTPVAVGFAAASLQRDVQVLHAAWG